MISSPFPFLRIKVMLGDRDYEEDALLDTGFNGDVAVPYHVELDPSGRTTELILGDGSLIRARSQLGQVQLGDLEPVPAEIIAMGSNFVIGTGILRHYEVILDHGQRVIVNL